MQHIRSSKNVFEVIEKIPCGYKIWNIGKNMVDGWLPLVRCEGYNVVGKMYALKCEGAQTILAAIGGGQDTVEKMERYVKRYRNAKPDTYSYWQVQRMEKAIPWMKSIGM